MAATLPVRAAVINGVSPSPMETLGFASASSSTSSIAALPFVEASRTGVTPKALAAFASAPARRSNAAASMSLR